MTERKYLTGAEMAESITAEFKGASAPVSAEHFAALYAVIAAQIDATQAVFALAMKANPKLIFEDVAMEAKAANATAADVFADALVKLAKAYGNTEGRSEDRSE